jgi:hypothetical protein
MSQPTEEPITNGADKQRKRKALPVTTEKTHNKQSKRRKSSSLEAENTIIEYNTPAAIQLPRRKIQCLRSTSDLAGRIQNPLFQTQLVVDNSTNRTVGGMGTRSAFVRLNAL